MGASVSLLPSLIWLDHITPILVVLSQADLTCVQSPLLLHPPYRCTINFRIATSHHIIGQIILSFLRMIAQLVFKVDTVAKFADPVGNFAIFGRFWLFYNTDALDSMVVIVVLLLWPCEVARWRIVRHYQVFSAFVALLRLSAQRLSWVLMVWEILVQSSVMIFVTWADRATLRVISLNRLPLWVIFRWGEVGQMRRSLLARRVKRYTKLLLQLHLFLHLRVRSLHVGVWVLTFASHWGLQLCLLFLVNHPSLSNQLCNSIIQTVSSLRKVWLHVLVFLHELQLSMQSRNVG